MKKVSNHELIIVLVNQGFTDAIIQASRKAGASGGTILTARASTREKAAKNYGISIASDKDVVMILVDHKAKKPIMDAIYKVSGIETKGMAIIFTIPADHVVGLRKPKANKK